MTITNSVQPSRWLIYWIIAFLAFPPAGALATAVIGSLNNPLQGALGGGIVGVIVGAAHALALRRRLNVGALWIAATAVGLALGVGMSTWIVGNDASLSATLLRAPITGLLLGTAQAWILHRSGVKRAPLWGVVITLIFPLAWYFTALVITTNLSIGFVIFGAAGAVVYQLLTGLVLWWLLRP